MSFGGGSTTTNTQATYPDEFKPLASSAVRQIQAAQGQLPLVGFTQYAPQGTAGLSAAQQFGIDQLLPATLLPSEGLRGLLALPMSVGQIANRAIGSSGPLGAENVALARLLGQADSAGAGLGAGAASPLAGGLLPPSFAPQTIFPGLTPQAIAAARPGISRGDTPVLGGTGPSVISPSQPMGASAFPNPFQIMPPDLTHTDSLRALIPEAGRAAYDAAIAAGLGPQDAYAQAINAFVQQQNAQAIQDFWNRFNPFRPNPDLTGGGGGETGDSSPSVDTSVGESGPGPA